MNVEQMNMDNVKVYKTNVMDPSMAHDILDKIRLYLPDSNPSFDLEDCDKVLRVETQKELVDDVKIRGFVKATGHHIEELP